MPFFAKIPVPVLLLLWVPLIAGCSESQTVSLYSVTDVYPGVIEPGDVLTIEGEGFIEGKAKIEFDGTVKPMGLRPHRPFHQTLYGTAISETRIEIPVTPHLMDKIAAESLRFKGVVSVSFPNIHFDSAVSLTGKSSVQKIEFRPTGGGIKIHAQQQREARQSMMSLGLDLASAPGDDVIQVAGVVRHSYAEQLGISAGAKLISIDGFPLLGIDELAGLEMDRTHVFEFLQPEGGAKKVQIRPNHQEIKNDEFAAILLTSMTLGLFLAFILPAWIRKSIAPPSYGKNPLSLMSGYAIAALVTVLFPAVVIQWELNLSGTILLAAAFVICNAILMVYSRHSFSTRLSNSLGGMFAISAILLMGGAAGNTLGLFNAAMAQSASVFGFHVWKNPVMLLACLLAISMLWPGRFTEDAPPLLFVAAWMQTISGAIAAVFFCFGGWTIPGMPDITADGNIWMLLVGLIVFCTKTWIVLMAARQLAGADDTERRSQATISSLYQLRWAPLPLLAAGAIYMELSIMPDDIQLAGQIISTGIFCTLLSLFVFSRLLRLQKQRLPTG